jgi:transposase InsO family protein
MNRLPTSQRHHPHAKRWKRYEKPQPGLRVQMGVKFLGRIGDARRKYYQYTAIDDCTRIRMLRIYDKCNQVTSIRFLDYVLEKLPFRVEVIQTDNGAEFQSQLRYHILDRGIRHVYIGPATPRLNGKVERSHRIDQEEFYRMLKGAVIDDTKLFNDKLQEWEDFYNFNRPHGGLAGDTPFEELPKKTTTPM